MTISYLDPRELSHATRRHHLWEQHRFDIGDGDTDGLLREMDLVGGKIPKSSKHHRREDAALHLEMALEELEGHMAEIKSSIHDGEAAKAMEMGSLELVASATDQLENESHVLLIRVRRLHLDAAEAVTRLRTDDLTPAQINGVMCRFVETALKLLERCDHAAIAAYIEHRLMLHGRLCSLRSLPLVVCVLWVAWH